MSCRRDHDLTGQAAGTTSPCGCGAVVVVAAPGDAPLPCPCCASLVAPSLGQCGACLEVLFTTACAGCGETLFEGHRFCVRCGVAVAAPPAPRAATDPWAEGTPVPVRARAGTEIEAQSLPWRPIWRVDLAAGGTPAGLRTSRGACPRCRVPLARRSVGALEIDPCRCCGGMFFDAEVLARLLIAGDRIDAATLDARCAVAAEPAPPPALGAIAWCPCCAGPMRSHAVAPRGRGVGLVCRSHGMWVDRGELVAVVRVLTVRSQGRAGDLERAAFRHQITRQAFDELLHHARALGARVGARMPRTPMGLLAELFG